MRYGKLVENTKIKFEEHIYDQENIFISAIYLVFRNICNYYTYF